MLFTYISGRILASCTIAAFASTHWQTPKIGWFLAQIFFPMHSVIQEQWVSYRTVFVCTEIHFSLLYSLALDRRLYMLIVNSVGFEPLFQMRIRKFIHVFLFSKFKHFFNGSWLLAIVHHSIVSHIT